MKIKKVTDQDILKWLDNEKTYSLKPYTRLKRIDTVRTDILDCHGMYIHDAFNAVQSFVENCYENEIYCVTIITGKSGIIRKEFKEWISNNKYVRNYKLLSNNGSWRIKLLRK